MRYEHVANNGNGGKGRVEEVWEISDATHRQPPAPPPAPPSPSPPPAGMRFECATDEAFRPPKALKLKDSDVDEHSASVAACQQTCNAEKGCVALRYNKSDKHCHVLLGVAPTHGDFTKALVKDPGYYSCILVNGTAA